MQVFTQRQLLTFPSVLPGAQCSLPFFAHLDLGHVMFTSEEGRPLAWCEDSTYRANDHRLLWVAFCAEDVASNQRDRNGVTLYLYYGARSAHLCVQTGVHVFSEECEVKLLTLSAEASEVFLVADYFPRACQKLCRGRWKSACKASAQFVSTVERPGNSSLRVRGGALRLNSSDGAVDVSHEPRVKDRLAGLLHVRAHFFDADETNQCATHWIELSSHLGQAAIGITPDCPGFYAASTGNAEMRKWQKSAVCRSSGWHVLEVLFEDGKVTARVDGQSKALMSTWGSATSLAIRLYADGGSPGIWGAVELLHAPTGYGVWERPVQLYVTPGSRRPWSISVSSHGNWIVDAESGTANPIDQPLSEAEWQAKLEPTISAVVEAELEGEDVEEPEESFVMAPELNEEQEEVEPMVEPMVPTEIGEEVSNQVSAALTEEIVAPDIPAAHVIVQKMRRPRSQGRRQQRKVVPPVPPPLALTVECWTLPLPETALARMDRVMDTFLAKLREAGCELPENIHRLEACRDQQHADCFVYTFGTRRLHLATRELESGRLSLVVRCGGGFLDFAQFALRHGAVEQLKLQRRSGSGGKESVHLISVLANGAVTLRERS